MSKEEIIEILERQVDTLTYELRLRIEVIKDAEKEVLRLANCLITEQRFNYALKQYIEKKGE